LFVVVFTDISVLAQGDATRRLPVTVQSTPCLAVQPDGTVVLRPSRLRVKGWHFGSVGVLPFALVGIARAFLTAGWIGLLAVAAGVAVILLVLLGLHDMRLRRGAARLTSTEVIIPSWYGRRRAVPREQLARAVLVRARLGSRSPAVLMLLLIGGAGNCLLHLSGSGIPAPDVKAFAAALQVPVDEPRQEMGPGELRQDYPGAVSWWWSHQVLLAFLIAGAIVVIVIAVVVGLAAAGVIQGSSGQSG
jgi:hypothetical protein